MVEVRELALKKGVAVGIVQADYGTGRPLVAAFAAEGFIMCGLLDIGAAEKLGMAAARITGVSGIDELLEGRVVEATSKARALGLSEGMKGVDALEKLAAKS